MSAPAHSQLTDTDLLEQFHRTQDKRWLGYLLERYTLLLFGVCMKYLKHEEDARDAVQQVFLLALTELEKYRVDFVKSWLYVIARNHCLMKLRKKGEKTVAFEDSKVELPEESDAILLQRLKEKQFDLLQAALQQLPPEQKTCVRLFYLEKQSYHQVALQTGYTPMQVKSYIQNGKRNLKILLQHKLDNHG